MRKRLYALHSLPAHLAQAGRVRRLRRVLTDFSFLQAKVDAFGPDLLMEDYDYHQGVDPEVATIRESLALSRHVLAQGAEQLAGQLLGRLSENLGFAIRTLLQSASAWRGPAWLRPRTPSLTHPGGPMKRTLAGHSRRVVGVTVVNPRWVVSAGDRTLRVWDVETGECLHLLSGHPGLVSAVATLDDQRIISSCHDGSLRIWDVRTGKTLRSWRKEEGDSISALTVLAGRRVVSSHRGGTLQVWEVESGRWLRSLEGHGSFVEGLLATDRHRVVSLSRDSVARIWNVETGQCLHVLEGARGDSPWGGYVATDIVRGRFLAFGCGDCTLSIWDLQTGALKHSLQGHSDTITSVAALDEKMLVSASADSLRVWDVDTGENAHTLEQQPVKHPLVAALDHRRILYSYNTNLNLWDLHAGTTQRLYPDHESSVNVLVVMDDRRVVSASQSLRAWCLDGRSDGMTLTSPPTDPEEVAQELLILGNGRVLSSWSDGIVRIWSIESGTLLGAFHKHNSFIGSLRLVEERWILSASHDGTLRIWDVETGEDLIATRLGSGFLWEGITVLDRHWILMPHQDGKLAIRNVENDRTLGVLEGHEDWITAIAVLDDVRCVSASRDETLRVWSFETGDSLKTLRGHRGVVTDVKMLDQHRIVSTSNDGTLRVWDIETGQCLSCLGGPEIIHAVAVLDAQRVVSGANDNTLRVWDLKKEQESACFVLEGHVIAVAFDARRSILVASDNVGRVHFLDLVEPVVGRTSVHDRVRSPLLDTFAALEGETRF